MVGFCVDVVQIPCLLTALYGSLLPSCLQNLWIRPHATFMTNWNYRKTFQIPRHPSLLPEDMQENTCGMYNLHLMWYWGCKWKPEINFLNFNEEIRHLLQDGSEWASKSAALHLSIEKILCWLEKKAWVVRLTEMKTSVVNPISPWPCSLSHPQNPQFDIGLPGAVEICLLLKFCFLSGKHCSVLLSTCWVSMRCSPSTLCWGFDCNPKSSKPDLISFKEHLRC